MNMEFVKRTHKLAPGFLPLLFPGKIPGVKDNRGIHLARDAETIRHHLNARPAYRLQEACKVRATAGGMNGIFQGITHESFRILQAVKALVHNLDNTGCPAECLKSLRERTVMKAER